MVFVSPRIRAHHTFHLLFDHVEHKPAHVITEEVREWDYGDYEGLKPDEIKARNPTWKIWQDGCPGGESAEEMCHRVDVVISKVCSFEFLIDGWSCTSISIGQGTPPRIFGKRNRF
jgi:sedoheptulose-bisphosphatase